MGYYAPGGGTVNLAPITLFPADGHITVTPSAGDVLRLGETTGATSGMEWASGAIIDDSNNPNLINLHTPNGANLNVGSNTGVTVTGPLALASATTGTTAPGAGGAGALPATPKGYVTISINGTNQQMPYY